MAYDHQDIEKKWRDEWEKRKTYKVTEDPSKPKFYALDMFPYPSGAGLHVGHPLGYIASDIVARYKRLSGFNVLHPMGYDAFGLPAEQYAIQTGQHPVETTKMNIEGGTDKSGKEIQGYRKQLDGMGFSFDWSREVRTSDSNYYKWTQWIFLKLFNSYYCDRDDKAKPIEELIARFEKEGCLGQDAHVLTGDIEEPLGPFTAEEWANYEDRTKQMILQHFRLAYLSEAWVNWCPALGTVLANDEVKDGVSERGGHPVERKRMPQWSLRITAYADRLLQGLDDIDWPDAMKETQRNWIGRSEGASVFFEKDDDRIEVFTTRPDTLFGVTFMTLAPEHVLVEKFTTPKQHDEVMAYVEKAKNRSERERQMEVENVSGVFTGSYAKHPFTGKDIPIWVGDYVLAGYGTGAVMAVPGGDQRDWRFAKHFDLPIIAVTEGADIEKEADESKDGVICNSDFLNGMKVQDAIKAAIAKLEELGAGEGKVNYRLRDAAFGRQRYWGEPIPIYYKDDIPYPMDEADLPLVLPEIDKYQPTEDGEPPLARAENWTYTPLPGRGAGGEAYPLETTTMPGWAASSWYYLRYMDPHNSERFASEEAIKHWGQIDLYVGGSEHGTGHLLYFRFWTKFLHDLGLIPFNEPAKKLVNQGMIQGVSAYIFEVSEMSIEDESDGVDAIEGEYLVSAVSASIIMKQGNPELVLNAIRKQNPKIDFTSVNLRVSRMNRKLIPVQFLTEGNSVDLVKLHAWSQYWPSNHDSIEFITEYDGKFESTREIEKMSKSKWNVVNPDDIIEQYGADTLRLYEMFLGPLEQSKPWDTHGIEGTSRFLKKFWGLFHLRPPKGSDDDEVFTISDEEPTKEELKALHATLKKVSHDIEAMAFNTCVSQFMIALNELQKLKCNKRAILEPMVIALAPFAPHICEELWQQLGHDTSVCDAEWPKHDDKYLVEDSFKYPISFNGKMRLQLDVPAQLSKEEIEAMVMDNEEVKKRLEGKEPKKVIVVPKRIVNIVV